MAMQTTLDTFTTVKQYYNSNVKTITISTHVPALEAPVTPSIEPITVKTVVKLSSAEYALPDISCYEDYSRLQSSTIYSMDQPEPYKLPDRTNTCFQRNRNGNMLCDLGQLQGIISAMMNPNLAIMPDILKTQEVRPIMLVRRSQIRGVYTICMGNVWEWARQLA
jgi:hypothetical protein